MIFCHTDFIQMTNPVISVKVCRVTSVELQEKWREWKSQK